MALRSELAELLAGFEKRMQFINIVRSLLEYRYPDEIRMMIPNKKVLDNMILAVLVYIKDRTLGTEQTCTVQDIERFLDDFSPVLPEDCTIDSAKLAKYIVVDVLQNGGVLTEFLTFDSVTETFKPMPVRLLNEEKGSYHLTDEAFDFLFRSKEIESELDYSVTRFRMKEYMKRDNYEKALDASRELVSRIRSMKVSMDDFLLQCRENISKITVDQYDTVILRIRSLLETEYKELSEIQKSADERRQNLEKAYQNGVGDKDIQKRRKALQEIIQNISLTIEEQRILINKKTSLAESYQTLIRDQFIANRFERLNFEKDILAPLRKANAPLETAAQYLLFPMMKPSWDRHFSIENFYAPQANIIEHAEDSGIDITSEESDTMQQLEIRNQRYLGIVRAFFAFAQEKERFSISHFVESLRISELLNFCQENALPNVLLSLFAMQEIDLDGWKKSERFTVLPNGEFELSWCLEELPPELLNAKQIVFQKLESTFRFSAEIEGIQHNIEMTDFAVEVRV